MKCLSIVLMLSAGMLARAGQYEFATLSFPASGIRWVDKSGARSDTATGSTIFAELSGQDRNLARSAQYKVLVLNGLSKSGWDVVHVSDVGGEETYLLRQAVTGAAAGGAPSGGAVGGAHPTKEAEGKRVPLTFSGGHETDQRDGGRPVVLIAAALGVPGEVFRETFTHVTPAAGGREPEPDQVRRNKQALMRGLSPYGITNDRLDTVSNFYRYNGSRGEMWRNTPAAGYAMVKDGVVTSITITEAGAGYSSQPSVSVDGMDGVTLKATLVYGTDFKTNGSVKEITVAGAAAR